MDETLEQLLATARTCTDFQLASVLEKALNLPNLFEFGEFLDLPNVQQLEGKVKPALDRLKLFAWGTYADYRANALAYGKLSQRQLTKLKQLTIVSLAAKKKVIPYDVLLKELDISSVRELEDLIIFSIYQNVFSGKLDQQRKHLEVEWTIGRDLRPGQLDEVLLVLQTWYNKSSQLLSYIENRLQHISEVEEINKKNAEELETRAQTMKENLRVALHAEFNLMQGIDYAADSVPQNYMDQLASGIAGPASMPKKRRNKGVAHRGGRIHDNN